MMARQHANLGVTGFLAIGLGARLVATETPLNGTAVGAYILEIVNPVSLAFFVSIAAACALVPDFDGKRSTISQRFPLTGRIFRIFFRKHRGFSHSLWAAIAFGLIGFGIESIDVQFVVFDQTMDVSRILLSMILMGSVSLVLPFILPFNIGWHLYHLFLLVLIAVCLMLNFTDVLPPWGLGITVFLGAVLHSVGDSLTPSGVAWLYPFTERKLSIPINGRTGQTREARVTKPILIISSAAMIVVAIILPLTQAFVEQVNRA